MMPYRLHVAGLALPLAAIRIRRRVGQSTFATLAIPQIAPLATLQAAVGAEGQVVDPTGAEWLKIVLTEVDSERDPYHASTTLTGRVINPPFTAQTWTLRGVRNRDADEAGRRIVTCDPLPELRPNDTVFDGLANWTVRGIDLDLTPESKIMRVSEA